MLYFKMLSVDEIVDNVIQHRVCLNREKVKYKTLFVWTNVNLLTPSSLLLYKQQETYELRSDSKRK